MHMVFLLWWGNITTEHIPHALPGKTGGGDLYLYYRWIFLSLCISQLLLLPVCAAILYCFLFLYIYGIN